SAEMLNANLTGIAARGGVDAASPSPTRGSPSVPVAETLSSRGGVRRSSARQADLMAPSADMPPRQIAAMKKQLAAINARLLSLERERRELKHAIAYLSASLQRFAGPGVGTRRSPSPQPTGARGPQPVAR